MKLVADIGNTSITFAIFQDKNIVQRFKIASRISQTSDDHKKELKQKFDFKIDECVIISVVEGLEIVLKKACDELFGIKSKIFSAEDAPEIKLAVTHPETVGADRIANAKVVAENYSLPAIVVDLGSATTFDIVSKDKEFFGGIILAGLDMQLRALNQFTSKLPKYNVKKSEKAIGVDTETAIMSGVVRGSASAIDGLISQCEAEMGVKATVVLTGGYAEFISEYMSRKPDFIDTDLTLKV